MASVGAPSLADCAGATGATGAFGATGAGVGAGAEVGGFAGSVGFGAGAFGRGNGCGVCAYEADTHKLNTTKAASLITQLL